MPWDANGNWIQGDGTQPQGGYVPSGGGEPGSNLGSGGAPNWWDQNYPAPGVSPQQANKAAASGPQGGDYQGWFQQLMNGANDQASLLSHKTELEAAGFHISPANASGEISKIQTPDGQWVRVIGAGEGHPVWIPQGGSSGSSRSGGGSDSGGGMTDQERANYGVPNNQYASNPYSGGYTAPQWTGSFTAPTNITEQNDPGYQARLDADQQARQRSAAAQGTILNGGTQQALGQAAQNYASNEYSNVFNRAFEQYQQKYGEFNTQNQQNLGAEQNQYQEYLGNNQRTLSDYLTNYNIGRTGVQDFLNQNNATANRGLTAVTAGRPS